MSLLATSSQTVGPYVAIGFARLHNDSLAPAGVTGERITVTGRIVDGDGAPMTDAVVEIWQANAHGRYAHPEAVSEAPLEPAFKGFGRIPTDADGHFRFTSVKPGRVPGPGAAVQAPHLNVLVFSRGLLKHLSTRMYFPDDPANAEDSILQRVPAERRQTLIARQGGSNGELEWNIVLQGADETVFFDL